MNTKQRADNGHAELVLALDEMITLAIDSRQQVRIRQSEFDAAIKRARAVQAQGAENMLVEGEG